MVSRHSLQNDRPKRLEQIRLMPVAFIKAIRFSKEV